MAVGNIWFYSGARLWDRLIQQRTGGPWSHVAVEVDNAQVVEAVSTGIRYRALSTNRPDCQALATSDVLLPARLADALAWLTSRVGHPYGWDDILNNAWKQLLPNAPALTWSDRWDCSDLATRFLILAGFPATPALLDFSTVSPNDLHRACMALELEAVA